MPEGNHNHRGIAKSVPVALGRRLLKATNLSLGRTPPANVLLFELIESQ
jgi:hypothetical protein